MNCPACGCKFEVVEAKDSNPDDMEEMRESPEEEDAELKKSVLDSIMGLGDETRKSQLPKKGVVMAAVVSKHKGMGHK